MTKVDRLGASLLVSVALACVCGAATTAPPAKPSTATSNSPATPAAPAAPGPVVTSSLAERLAVYEDFRELFDAAKYSDAIAPAEKLVAMTEAAGNANDPALVAPLVNLATTRYQLNDYTGAEAGYLRAISIIEKTDGGLSRKLLPPLRGLGLTYLNADQSQAAMEQLRRGVDIVRKVDGLFDEAQLDLLDPLVRAYQQLGQMADAEREAIYSYRVSENKYGRNSSEVVPALEKLARWYSSVGRNTTARQYFSRAAGILQKNLGPSDQRMISPLRGIAQTYRLEYIFGPELSASEQQSGPAATATLGGSLGTPAPGPEYNPAGAKPDAAGEAALRGALEIAESARPNIDTSLHVQLLIELGDWLLLDGDKDGAMQNYKRAWPLLKDLPAPDDSALGTPFQILYRPPSVAYRSTRAKAENIVEGFVDVAFTVLADGRVTGEHTVAKNATDNQEHSVLSAIKKARYRPRFDQGEPVATQGVRMHQVVFNVKSAKPNN
ncbi:MAG: energy transducer TonB [Steroidobacterales bacterium]